MLKTFPLLHIWFKLKAKFLAMAYNTLWDLPHPLFLTLTSTGSASPPFSELIFYYCLLLCLRTWLPCYFPNTPSTFLSKIHYMCQSECFSSILQISSLPTLLSVLYSDVIFFLMSFLIILLKSASTAYPRALYSLSAISALFFTIVHITFLIYHIDALKISNWHKI